MNRIGKTNIGPHTSSRSNMFGFSHTLGLHTGSRRNVFGFSHTFGPHTGSRAQCVRFFAYIGTTYRLAGAMCSVLRIHWDHIPARGRYVFGFTHTLGHIPAHGRNVFGFSHTLGLYSLSCRCHYLILMKY